MQLQQKSEKLFFTLPNLMLSINIMLLTKRYLIYKFSILVLGYILMANNVFLIIYC